MTILVEQQPHSRLQLRDETGRSPGRHRRTGRWAAPPPSVLGGTGSVGRREAPVIEALGLGRTFGSKAEKIEAVHDVSFTVRQGEIVGFLGSNGAGKTTMMRLLTTLLSPTAGDALVVGSSLRQDPRGVRRHIGYVAQRGSTHGDSRVLEQLVLQGRLHRMTVKQTRERAEELCEVLDLTDLVDRPAKVLSGGQRRRLDIALGLMHHPSLLILDEPTTGLDPQNRGTMWEHVRKLRHELGTTVFLTTHYLDEADELCDQILLMSRGTIVDTGTPDQLKRRISGDIVTLEINGYPEDAWRALEILPAVREISVSGLTLSLAVDDGERQIPGLLHALDVAGVGVGVVRLTRPTLDDVFRALTNSRRGNTSRDAAPDRR